MTDESGVVNGLASLCGELFSEMLEDLGLCDFFGKKGKSSKTSYAYSEDEP